MIKEIKEFLLKSSAVDLAVGIIFGAAFGKIVTSIVNDIIMPPIGLLLGKVNFKDLFINLSDKAYPSLDAAAKDGAATINYGAFLNTIIEFVIIGLVLFFLIRAINGLRSLKPSTAAEVTTKTCPFCQSEIPLKATRCPHCTSELL